MSSLRWKVNRIKAMGLGEIVFRVSRMFQTLYERKKIESGWQPFPSGSVSSNAPLFGNSAQETVDEWRAAFGEFEPNAYELALHQINLFDSFSVDISGDIDWHVDPESGIRSPLAYGKDIDYRDNALVGNCKTLWELSRHKHLVPLAAAYAISGEHKYLDKVVAHIDGWIEQNPFGIGIHWCSSLEVSLRLIAWSVVHSMIRLRDPEGLFGKSERPFEFGVSVYQHAYFIFNYLSRYSSANNHLIGELTGLWVGCNIFNFGEDSEVWSRFAKIELESEAKKQVFDDGVSREQATYYHLWVNEYLLLSWLIGLRYSNQFSEGFAERISRMTQFLLDLSPDQGQVPQIGDSDDGLVLVFDPDNKTNPYDDMFSAVSKISGGDAYPSLGVTSKAYWYKRITSVTEAHEHLIPRISREKRALCVYPGGGYAIINNDSFHAVFDAGSLGYPSIAAHGHADALSLCVAWDADWWIVDPGTYCYHTEPDWRNYFRGTGAHNTVYIDDVDQSLIGGAFLWLKHAKVKMGDVKKQPDGSIRVSGSVTGYAKFRPTHDRELELIPHTKTLKILDTVTTSSKRRFEVRYHFHPDVDLQALSATSFLARRRECSRRVQIELDAGLEWCVHSGETNPHLGWYSEVLGIKRPCQVLVGCAINQQTSLCVTSIRW